MSLPVQTEDILEHCAKQGYEFIRFYEDEGVTASTKRRPGFLKMLSDVALGEFDVIVCWHSWRLTRGIHPASAIIEALEGTQVSLDSVTDYIDLGLLGILAGYGNIELAAIKDRATMGARGRAERGLLSGRVKYGYRKGDEGKPVIDPVEADIVIRIFAEYANGLGCLAITDALFADGIFNRAGKKWERLAIWQIVSSSTYIGNGIFGQRKYIKRDDGTRLVTHTIMQPEENLIEIPYPPIITNGLWRKAQRERMNPSRQQKANGKTHNSQFLLRNLLWCGNWGCKFTPQASWDNSRYTLVDGTRVSRKTNTLRRRYVCRLGAGKGTDCPNKRRYAGKLEETVWKIITDFLTHPEQVESMIENRKRQRDEQGSEFLAEKAWKSLANVAAEKGQVLSMFQKKYITEAELDLRMKNISEQVDYHKEEIKRLESELENSGQALAFLNSFTESAANMVNRLDTMTFEERIEVVALLLDRITVEPEKIQIVMALDIEGDVTFNSPSQSLYPRTMCL